MKRFMTKTLLLVAFNLFSFNAVGETAVTEKTISSFLDFFESAVKEKNAAKMAELIAKDAVIEITEILPEGDKKEVWDVEMYLKGTQLTWKMVKNYSYAISNLKIHVNADKKSATVTDTVRESGKMYGENFSSTTDENIIIELRNERLVITKIIARTKIEI